MAKYTQDQINAMGAKGHAFKNPDGHYSYPIGDGEDLHNAIHAVGRGGASHDAIRKYIIGRAKALGMSSAIPDGWNASGSSSSSAPRDPGWEQRRRRWAGSLVGERERRSLALARGNVEVRAKPDGAGGTNFEFRGYASTFSDPFQMWDKWGDPYEEDVEPGSFTATLARPDLDVPFLIGHNDAGIPMARTRSGTLRLAQDTRGLHSEATLSGRRSDVRDLADAVERGDMDEMSIGFVTLGQHWSDDWMQRHLTELDLHRGDVSVVALAANPATRGATMIAMPGEAASRWRPAESRADASAAGDTLHPPFTGTHTHGHPSYSAAEDGAHEHAHDHSGDADHDHHGATTDDADSDHMTPTLTANPVAAPDGRAAHRHLHEARAADDASGEIADVSDAADYNPGATSGGLCVNPQCSLGGAAATCPQCGGPLYNEDGTIVLDDSGVVEEVGGAMADADLLSRRLRLLELA